MEIKEIKGMNTISIRETANVKDLPQVMGKAYGEIMTYMQKNNIQPINAPYARYYNEDMENLDVEMGIPVQNEVKGEGRIKSSKLPAGKFAVSMHVGPYRELGQAYEKIIDEIKEKGLETAPCDAGNCYELYIDDPQDTPENELKTEIYFMLK